jgi:hypothetical protein
MGRFNRLVLAALFALAPLAHAAPLQLLAPASGTTLRGGSFAELSWTADELPAGTEEWEAFLSIDGGTYYAFRVTPHLDSDLRRFTFIVPNVDTNDARILIRTGNEIRETHFEAPGSFTIVRDPHAAQVVSRLSQSGHGEAARDGDRAVIAWTDGARDGSGLSEKTEFVVPPLALTRGVPWLGEDGSAENQPGDALPTPAIPQHSGVEGFRQLRRAESLVRVADLLLLCGRMNV